MRQAFIVTNPKWEPYPTVSDAAKKAPVGSVIVVRGRCKEVRPVISSKKFVKNAAETPEEKAADAAKAAAAKKGSTK